MKKLSVIASRADTSMRSPKSHFFLVAALNKFHSSSRAFIPEQPKADFAKIHQNQYHLDNQETPIHTFSEDKQGLLP